MPVTLSQRLGRLANAALSHFGLSLVYRTRYTQLLDSHRRLEKLEEDYPYFQSNYQQANQELQRVFKAQVFPDLQDVPGRAELMAHLIGTGQSEALYIAGYLQRALGQPGDVCEFGVAQGATSAFLANELLAPGIDPAKRLWLFDSFEGLPTPSAEDRLIDDIFKLGSMQAYTGTMRCAEDWVQYRLHAIGFPEARTQIVKGFIEQTLQASPRPDQVCFAYIDLDFYAPILTALNFLADRLSPSGALIIDDYGFFSEGAQTAVDQFVAANPQFMLTLPPAWAGHFAILTHRLTQKGDRDNAG